MEQFNKYMKECYYCGWIGYPNEDHICKKRINTRDNKDQSMTKNLSAISELKEAIDALYELHRDVFVFKKYGITNSLTTQVQDLIDQATAKIVQLEKN